MKIAVASLGTSLDAWTGIPFGVCTRFLVVDTETMDFVVVSVPQDELEPSRVSLAAIRALVKQDAGCVMVGHIKDLCRQALANLGIEVIDGVEGITVREAIELYATGGAKSVKSFERPQVKIAVASHGDNLDATLSQQGEPCTSFVLVDPESWDFQVVRVESADSPTQASVNAVRAAARSGATVVITPEIRPACCTALSALAITVALADQDLTVREAVQAYQRGELASPAYL